MTCDCVNVEMGSYRNQQVFLSPTKRLIGIDRCLVFEITHLWQSGINTIASCCGHNAVKSTIVVMADNESLMIEMGYKGKVNKHGVLEFEAKMLKPETFKPVEVIRRKDG